jgi:hypothetical protein
MIITPKVSNDAAASEAQANSTSIRRGAESQISTAIPGAAGAAAPNALSIQTNVSAAGESEGMDLDADVPDAHAADRLMNSLRAGIPGQPGAAMLAQANLPPQSVYDLLQ